MMLHVNSSTLVCSVGGSRNHVKPITDQMIGWLLGSIVSSNKLQKNQSFGENSYEGGVVDVSY